MLALPPEQGVPVLDMRGELTVFQGLDNPNPLAFGYESLLRDGGM